MKEQIGKARGRERRSLWVGSLLFCCLSPFATQTASGQAPMPPIPAKQPETAPLPDPFFEALSGLSKRFGVAFVAEGRPFLLGKTGSVPTQGTEPAVGEATATAEVAASSPNDKQAADAEVQKVANQFDYEAVRQGNVYLLGKRYTNPDDMPDVTLEECRISLRSFLGCVGMYGALHDRKESITSIRSIVINQLYVNARARSRDAIHDPMSAFQGINVNLPGNQRTGIPDFPWHATSLTTLYYFASHRDRIEGVLSMLDRNRAFDPVFRWQTIGQHPVFGYDTQLNPQADPLFLPASDCDRVVVTPYGTLFPRDDWWMRTDTILPDQDPTDPAGLSEQTRRFLDDNGRSSRAIPLSEVIAAINRRVPKKPGWKLYKVDWPYASKHVTLVGADKLPPGELMQSLAAVYGLRVNYNLDDTVVLTMARSENPSPKYVSTYRPIGIVDNLSEYVRANFPSPIYRLMHARFLAGRTKPKNQDGPRLLEYETQYELQRMATTFRNSAMRELRYLVEPQVKAQSKAKLPLSRLGEREHILFTLAQTASGFADACELADVPAPPYITRHDDPLLPGRANIRFTGGVYPQDGSPEGPYLMRFPDKNARLALFVTYVSPQTGLTYGPIQILDMPLNYNYEL
ncbi:MAG: hypothetical protein JWN14_389 [Chthonomonadales bacterium]|nr:hypothetical protein [Chthonomonadales bacterium]